MDVEKKELEWLYVPDIEYCEYESCKRYLQLIIPYRRNWAENRKYPLILFIPGSAWHRQEMYNNIPARSELAQRGFAIAEVQYRESELVVFPAQVIDELENEGHCCPTFWGNDVLDIVEKFVKRNCK